MAGGALFMAMQAIHPPDAIESVTTTRWAVVHYLGVAMCLLALLGTIGIYARQIEHIGRLGLVGALALKLFWTLTAAFQFVEAFVSPRLVASAPEFVESFLGISSGVAGNADLGLLPGMYAFNGLLYLAGGVLLGLGTLRARVLPQWQGAMLAVSTVAPLVLAVLPHEFIRLAALPMGCALVCLGYTLWSEREGGASSAQSGKHAEHAMPMSLSSLRQQAVTLPPFAFSVFTGLTVLSPSAEKQKARSSSIGYGRVQG